MNIEQNVSNVIRQNVILHELAHSAISIAKNITELKQIEAICDEHLYVFPEHTYDVIIESIFKIKNFYIN